MCEQLAAIREAISEVNRRFDPVLVPASEAEQVVAHAAAIESIAHSLKAVAAARAAESGNWRRLGYRSAADALSARTGTSVGEAHDVLGTGRRLAEQPDVAAVARAGELSPAQTSLVCLGVDADPASTTHLVDTARHGSLTELRNEVARVKAGQCNLEERRRAIHAKRRVRTWTDVEGAWHLTAVGNVEDGAQIMAAIQPLADVVFGTARVEGRRESPEAYAFDALVQLSTESTGDGRLSDVPSPSDSTSTDSTDERPGLGGQPAPATGPVERSGPRHRRGARVKLLVRVDYDTLMRGVVVEGETCELVGYGPVPVSVVHDLLATGDPFIAAVLTKGRALVGVAHLGRQPTSSQQSALEWLYPSCAVQGCHAQAHLQRDHRIDWAQTHVTVLDHLDLLCAHHHNLKSRSNWALVEGSGKRSFVPPDDRRHPKHHPPGPDALASTGGRRRQGVDGYG